MIKDFEVQDVLFPECPVRNIIARVGDKWSLLVLHTLCNRKANMRFSALRKKPARHLAESTLRDASPS